jgi:hypothetical protein
MSFDAIDRIDKIRFINEIKTLICKLQSRDDRIDLLKAENKQLREGQKWVSVDDRWPKKGGFYMFFVNDEVRMIYFFPNFKKTGFIYKFNEATYWKALPKPPEGKS